MVGIAVTIAIFLGICLGLLISTEGFNFDEKRQRPLSWKERTVGAFLLLVGISGIFSFWCAEYAVDASLILRLDGNRHIVETGKFWIRCYSWSDRCLNTYDRVEIYYSFYPNDQLPRNDLTVFLKITDYDDFVQALTLPNQPIILAQNEVAEQIRRSAFPLMRSFIEAHRATIDPALSDKTNARLDDILRGLNTADGINKLGLSFDYALRN